MYNFNRNKILCNPFHFNVKNRPNTNMINSLVYIFKTHSAVTSLHPIAVIGKIVYTESAAKALFS